MGDKLAKNRSFWLEVISQVVALGGALLAAKLCMNYLDPYKEQREQAKKRAQFLRKHLGRSLELNEFEQLLAASVMNPAHIDVNISDVSGLDQILEEIELKVLLPLREPDLYCTTLLRQAKGVLLYGPPGTGKTMIARAIARQSQCFFLNVTVSSLLSKWLGDANRLVKAVFSLAEKLQPCIIFIDEVDALLGKRGASSEHEATLQLKTEFMQLWDGMESARGQRIVVLGATNRPWMVDEAVLRRFTLQFEIGLPNFEQRRAILQGYLRRHHHDLGGPSLLANGGSRNNNGGGGGGGRSNGARNSHDSEAFVDASEAPDVVDRALLNDLPVKKVPEVSVKGLHCTKKASSEAPSTGSSAAASTGSAAASTGSSSTGSSTGASASTSGFSSDGEGALSWLARHTEGFSGSDLLELCVQAAQRAASDLFMRKRDCLRRREAKRLAASSSGSSRIEEGGEDTEEDDEPQTLRPVLLEDFAAVLKTMRPSTHKAEEYKKSVEEESSASLSEVWASLLAASMARNEK